MAERTASTEKFFPDHEIIVSKTDPRGKIVYANKLFLDIAGYEESECLDQPHSLIRHPDMPRSVFGLLWDTIGAGQEIFAYVKNRTKAGDYYWVYAHVTPSFGPDGALDGYHSSRRVPNRKVLNDVIIPLYGKLLKEENRHGNRKDGVKAGTAMLQKILEEKGTSYDQFIHSL